MSLLPLFPDLPNPYRTRASDVAPLFDGEILFVSDWERIGTHDWCLVIYFSKRFGRPSSYYAWRRSSDVGQQTAPWHHGHAFPSYDHNRSDDGLPASLIVLWHRAEDERRKHGVA